MSTSLGRTSRLAAAAVAAVGLIATAAIPAGAANSPPPQQLAPIHGHYDPMIDRSNFVERVDNPFWPLKPGTGYHFKGARGTTPQRDDEIVTDRTIGSPRATRGCRAATAPSPGSSCPPIRSPVTPTGRSTTRPARPSTRLTSCPCATP
jgi:hypothetical protein